ncbi:hypothetical protein JQ824_03325 [Brachyspira hyodysenteriae]|uniref:Lipoprotein n=2 Tax=Brachyspira hyodysenteriae TaxID=159 RepID=A0A3B6W2H6_BRAHO|nr:hypothetical protein [Brachyspira hyodysenteriae]ANN62643.1 hypothetical protein BHYOB78_01830 [Brachyspira hyodysenteriae ATCC 27164]KLI13094.1 hypothetical protein SU46_13080 [Brachyspira hyodysenteriae]KLI15333.1 hypothetical protein SU44_08385 [Brachyspira hyodysenteriae]KLI20936.1 hypothetical protein SU43_11765 [Brachyspira hyodysenteriae]KLI21850.1 hypothetical protein SR30_12120 [Brachyspira hyodysenteriae]
MIKKFLLISAFIIFAVSCSGNNSNQTASNSIITNASEISNFLKKYDGRYYHQHEFTNGSYTHVAFRIENGNMYIGEDKTPASELYLSGNSLELNVNGNTQLSNTYNQIYSIIEVNLFDDHLKFSGKNIFDKEDFNIPDEDYIVIKQFKELGNYAGNYYIPTYDSNGQIKVKNYTILIDKEGNIYGYKGMTNVGMTFTLNGNMLQSEHNDKNNEKVIMSYELEKDRIIYQINFIYGKEYSYELMKSDIFTPYLGTYSSGDIIVKVEENNASINTSKGDYHSSIINGNDLTISEIFFENNENPIEIKEHKIIFSDDKTKASYIKPDGTTIELIKQ